MTTKAEIGQVLGVLGVVYRRQAVTAQQIKLSLPVWHELLGDLDFRLLKAAAHSHCATSQWFLSIAELCQEAFDLIASDSEQATAGEAWEEVKRTLSGEAADGIAGAIAQALDELSTGKDRAVNPLTEERPLRHGRGYHRRPLAPPPPQTD